MNKSVYFLTIYAYPNKINYWLMQENNDQWPMINDQWPKLDFLWTLWLFFSNLPIERSQKQNLPLMIHIWRMVTENCVWRKILKSYIWLLILNHCAWHFISKHCVWRKPEARQTPEIRRQVQHFKIMRQTLFSITMHQMYSKSPAMYSKV